MDTIKEQISKMLDSGCGRMVLSKPEKTAEYRKITITQKAANYQIEKFTEKQAFHENVSREELIERIEGYLMQEYRQLNGFGAGLESIFLISKKGKVTFKQKRTDSTPKAEDNHNRKKQYLLEEGEIIPPLIDMGIFTSEGKIVTSMYDKFRQINRFLELIRDTESALPATGCLHICDLCCGKSYLSFAVYHYFTAIRHREVHMVGVDMKADVMDACNDIARDLV